MFESDLLFCNNYRVSYENGKFLLLAVTNEIYGCIYLGRYVCGYIYCISERYCPTNGRIGKHKFFPTLYGDLRVLSAVGRTWTRSTIVVNSVSRVPLIFIWLTGRDVEKRAS